MLIKGATGEKAVLKVEVYSHNGNNKLYMSSDSFSVQVTDPFGAKLLTVFCPYACTVTFTPQIGGLHKVSGMFFGQKLMNEETHLLVKSKNPVRKRSRLSPEPAEFVSARPRFSPTPDVFVIWCPAWNPSTAIVLNPNPHPRIQYDGTPSWYHFSRDLWSLWSIAPYLSTYDNQPSPSTPGHHLEHQWCLCLFKHHSHKHGS